MPIPNQMARVRNHAPLRENYGQEVSTQISSARTFMNNTYGDLNRAYPALIQIEKACGPCKPTPRSCGTK